MFVLWFLHFNQAVIEQDWARFLLTLQRFSRVSPHLSIKTNFVTLLLLISSLYTFKPDQNSCLMHVRLFSEALKLRIKFLPGGDTKIFSSLSRDFCQQDIRQEESQTLTPKFLTSSTKKSSELVCHMTLFMYFICRLGYTLRYKTLLRLNNGKL